MRRAAVNGIELAYETLGDPSDPPLLLIAGLGVQLVDWPDDFLEQLVESGLHVIRFDNRDIGLSTTFEGAPDDPWAVLEAVEAGREPELGYTIADMAEDGVALLRTLGIESAHVLGNSMGGMIAQELAIRHPARVRSLISLMSSTGASDVGQPTPEALAAILRPGSGVARDAVVAHNVANAEVWASPGHFDPDALARRFERAWDRVGGAQAENAARHFCAIVAGGSRDDRLGELSMPALVMHGSADPLITPSGGERTAQRIRNAELVVIEGMAHDLAPVFVPDIASRIAEFVHRVDDIAVRI